MDTVWVGLKDGNLEPSTALRTVFVSVMNLVVLKAYELDEFLADQ